MLGVLLHNSLPYFLETEILNGSGGRLVVCKPQRYAGSASHSAGNIGTHTALPSFSVGAEDLNSGPHLPTVSAGLVTEPPTTTNTL